LRGHEVSTLPTVSPEESSGGRHNFYAERGHSNTIVLLDVNVRNHRLTTLVTSKPNLLIKFL
jgi:hypothetical protein